MPDTPTIDRQWIERLFSTIDDRDADAFASFLTEDGLFRWGSSDAVQGREAVRDFVAAFFDQFAALSHRIHGHWNVPGENVTFVQGDVTYVLPNRVEVTVPFLNLLRMQGGKAAEYLIYADPTPLFQVPKEG